MAEHRKPIATRSSGWRIRPRVLPSIAVILLLPALIALGLWQLERAAEKETRLSDYEARRADPPIAGIPAPADAESLRFRRIVLSGTFSPHRHLLLDNRTHKGMAGFHLWSILRLRDGRGVLVNRGWLPLGLSRKTLPEIPPRDGPQTVTGLLDLPPPRGLVLGPEGAAARGWPRIVQHIDPESLAREIGFPLAPVVILEDPGNQRGPIRDWQTTALSPARHRAYALQWFALAATLIVLFLVVSVRRQTTDHE